MSNSLRQLAERMQRVFVGNPDMHYVADFANAKIEKTGKLVPEYKFVPGSPTVDEFEAHLSGRVGLLVVPTTNTGSCRWGKIDVDEYPVDSAGYARKIARWGLPLIVELTKSGGAHLGHYSPVTNSAADLRERLVDWAATLGCSSRVEIFPKQPRLMPGEKGTGINLPYFGGDKAKNYALGPAGERLTVEQWLDRIERMPAKAQYTPGQVNVEAATDLLGQFWTEGQRDHLNLAVAGALLRAGVEEPLVQGILDGVAGVGADPEHRRSAASVAQGMESGKRIPGFPKLVEIMGRDAATEFMRLAGGKPPPDPLPFGFGTIPADWLGEAPPPLQYTIEPLLPKGVVGLLVAEGGTGKTTFGLRMVMSIAGGRPLFGLPTVTGKAVYLACEEHEDTLRRRMHWIFTNEVRRMREEGASPEAIDAFTVNVLANLSLRSAVGYELHLVKSFAGQVSQSGIVEALVEKLPRPLELLVLDPISRLNGGEENSNAVGTALINAAERIAREVGCTLMLSHHTGKAAAQDRDQGLYASRGASGFVDAARSSVRLLVANQDDVRGMKNIPAGVLAAGDLVRVVHNKSNEGPKAQPFWLRRQALDFELFTPEMEDGRLQHQTLIGLLWNWYCGHERKPFSKDRLSDAETRAQIFGEIRVGRDMARALMARALDEGDLVPAINTNRAGHNLLMFKEGYDDEM